MSRQWVRKETNIGDIKKLREAVERMSPNSEIIFDEYLTDQHSNEYCNVNKFYYGAIVENANETYQAYTGYGRIGINTGVNTSRVGGLKLQKEGGASSNYQTAKYYLDQKLDKKKKGKRCRKCGNWASYTAKTPEKMAESKKDKPDLYYLRMYSDSFMRENPTVIGEYGPYKLFEHPILGDSTYLYFYTPALGGLVVNSGLEHKNDLNFHKASAFSKNIVNAVKQNKFYNHTLNDLTKGTDIHFAESMNTQEFAKLMGAYPLPPDNQYAVGGFMDEGFEYTVNQAETFGAEYKGIMYSLERKGDMYKAKIRYELEPFYGKTYHNMVTFTKGKTEEETDKLAKELIDELKKVKGMTDSLPRKVKEKFGLKHNFEAPKKSFNWLNGLIGLGVALVGYDFLKKKVLKSDTIIENPNTGSLKPADYEELVVQSTGYYVPIIPVGLDPAFMGSRFHALPTDRYVYDDPQGIGAHIDVAMNQNTNFLPNEQSLVTKQSEAPGQSPYNSMQPNGQENPDFAYRAIHETTTVSLDGSVAKYIPQDLSGYTGQQFIPTSVYEDMLGIGISGQTPSFTVPASSGLGSNRFGSRMANPDTLTNVVGVLNENVNGDYTDGSNTMSLSQWTMNNQVQQISDTEAIVIERGSGSRKMIRRV
jgi:hypothetical protein